MQVWNTVVAEFSDVSDAEQLTQLILRLLIAALLGGLLGLEREIKGKSAGVRTHMLLAMGSALLVVVALQAGMDQEAQSRVIQGLLAGVGLLCAGAILKSSGDEEIYGLTTAAGLWMTTAIGIAAGMGREATAVICTLLALVILILERPFDRALARWRGSSKG